MAFQERADAEFGGEALGQFIMRLQGLLQVLQSEFRNELGVGKVVKNGHVAGFRARAEGGEEDAEGLGIVPGQMPAQEVSDPEAARHQVQAIVAGGRLALERSGVEGGMHPPDLFCDAAGNLQAEAVFQGLGHGGWNGRLSCPEVGSGLPAGPGR